ncbi:MAG: HAMP domain-containing protein [Rhodospirillales bacterium]|nr:HAMP domain-containing protein [Rhodospirillales bacterium]
MRIRTIIIIGVLASAVSAAIAGAEIVISTRWTDQAIARESAAHAIVETVIRRNLVLEDYLLHPGERARTQWNQAGETLARLIVAPELADPQSAPILAAIRENFMKVKNLFPRLAEIAEAKRDEGAPNQMARAASQQIEVQLQTAVRENLSLASRLERRANEQTIRQLLHARWLHIAAGGLLAVVLAGIWIALFREVFRPLKTVKTAIRKFGGGDQQARACLLLNNEIGEAARAFDDMADALETSTTSLEERTRQLEAANHELEAFCYSVSHDLRAPLRGMDGFCQALVEDYGDRLDDTGRSYLQRVKKACQTMAMLIDDLLKLSRVTRSEVRKGMVNLSTIAGAVAQGLRQTAPDRAVEFNIAPDLTATGDERLLRAAFENLLGNAWKYTSKKQRAIIEFGATSHNGARAYFVRDDGAGFDMAYADKLFQPFQRLHNASEFEGTGIGLATVQRIVHRHGGRVWAEAAVDKGATVYFTL